MSALRVARGATGRDLIVKFAGCYHGHVDGLLVAAGSGLATFSLPSSLGVPKSVAELTLVCPYNDPEALKDIFERYGDRIAAVIVEPVAGNMGLVCPTPKFIESLRDLPPKYGSLLILDEVITGFRVGLDGAQGFYGLKPDLTILGKIIGGGLPLAAFGGRADLMDLLAPQGGVYQAGTLSGNPLAVAAGLATLTVITETPFFYQRLSNLSRSWIAGLKALLKSKGLPFRISNFGSMFTVFFTERLVEDLTSAESCDRKLYGAFFRAVRDQGLWLPPSQFETAFLSSAFTQDVVSTALDMVKAGLKKI
jgi:glutamate-1-semialdehyde 2,1-aminomutase